MSPKWFAIWIIVAGMTILLLMLVIPAHAQEPTPENDENCVSCHEHQYYVYDVGKWFCLCEAPMHCVYCHGGRTDSLVEDVAHEGIVLYPTRDQAERCQACHTEDYLTRVVTFASVAGVSPTSRPVPTATAHISAGPVQGLPSSPALIQRFSHLTPWQIVGLGATLLAFIGIIILGYRCWKSDCKLKAQS